MKDFIHSHKFKYVLLVGILFCLIAINESREEAPIAFGVIAGSLVIGFVLLLIQDRKGE